jgi:hypothetical protein
MISHQHKCIFIHIPKNAGQSIELVFLGLLDLKWETRAPLLLRFNDRPELGPRNLAHLKASEYVRCRYLSQELFDAYFKFTFVRNPWARIISIYKYFGFNTRFEFKFFLSNVLKEGLWQEKYWFVCPQSDFVCDEDGRILVDFIGRFENLQNDFYHVCQKIGLPPIEVPHAHESSISSPGLSLRPKQLKEYVRYQLKGKHIPVYKRYQDYYDDESREFVAEFYKKDIDLFHYQFDENLPYGQEA